MVSTPHALRTVITSAIKDDIDASVQADEAFMSSATFREQYFNAYRILRDEHSPPCHLNSSETFSRYIAVLSAQVDHILCLFRAYEQVTTSTTVRAYWMRIGFQYEERTDTRYLTVDEAAVRSSPGLQEIWQFDYVLYRLSARRQSQKWGWVNQHLFRKKEIQCLKH
jgi:hypothetical protein